MFGTEIDVRRAPDTANAGEAVVSATAGTAHAAVVRTVRRAMSPRDEDGAAVVSVSSMRIHSGGKVADRE